MNMQHFDLNSLVPTEAITIDIIHPVTGELIYDNDGKNKKNFFVKVFGPHTKQYQRALYANRHVGNKANKKLKKNPDADELSYEDLQLMQGKGVKLLADITCDCYLINEKAVVECKPEALVKLYSELPWLKEQIETELYNKAGFIKA